MTELPDALSPLGAYAQFIICKLVSSTNKPGKMEKLPVDWRSGAVASAHDPAIWMPSQQALQLAADYGPDYLPYFVFTERDPFWFLDIDSCVVSTPAGPAWSPLARHLCNYFRGCAVECSTSGQGLHVFGQGVVPAHRTRPPAEINAQYPGLEFYTKGRFVALTGNIVVPGSAQTDTTLLMAPFVSTWFAGGERFRPSDWTTEPVPEWRGPTDDVELLRRAMQSKSAKSAFGDQPTFADLWTANAEVLGKKWPDTEKGRPFDPTRADAALAQLLAFWTGKNCERIERLMRQSALVRDKWDYHLTYLNELTIAGCVARQTQVLQDKSTPAVGDRAIDQAPGLAFKEVDVAGAIVAGIQPQVWWWEDYIPAGHVTRLAGHGGAGKSMLALMLAVCIANGAPFLGKPTRRANVLFYSAEDPTPMLARRLRKVAEDLGFDSRVTGERLRVIDVTECDPALFRGERIDAQTTETYERLHDYMERYSIDVVIVDNSSDAFDADEVRRAHVRKFMTALSRLVRARGGAVLLLAHVDKMTSRADRASGAENYSGSTAWHNSSRSRIFLRESAPGMLVLEHQKSNDGCKALPLNLIWPKDGLPQVIDLVAQQEAEADRGQRTMRAVLRVLADACGRGESISPAPNSPNSAARRFSGRPGFPVGLRPSAIADALNQAEAKRLIEREQYVAAHRNMRARWRMTALGVEYVGNSE